MSNLIVNNLQEFLYAAENGQTTDEIICPQNAVWDFTETQATTDQKIIFRPVIRGNNTTLKNLRGYIRASGKNIYNFNIENAICNNVNTNDYVNSKPFWLTGVRPNTCKFSVQLGENVQGARGLQTLYSSFYIKTLAQGDFYFNEDWVNVNCNRIKIEAPNATRILLGSYNDEYPNEYIFECPNLTTIQWAGYVKNSTFRGNMPSLTTLTAETQDYTTNIFNKDSMPNFPVPSKTNPLSKWFVTDAHMKDPEYLQSIGFDIVRG